MTAKRCRRDVKCRSSTATLLEFIDWVEKGKFSLAVAALVNVFGLSHSECFECSEVFRDRFSKHPNIILKKVLQMKADLQAGKYNDAQILLHECFGIQGPPALFALEMIRRNPETFH